MGYLSEHKHDIAIGTAATVAAAAIALLSRRIINFAEATVCLRDCNVPKTIAKDFAHMNNASIKKQVFAKDFSFRDRRIFKTEIQDEIDYIRIFQSTLVGKKPACLLAGVNRDLHFLDKGKYNSAIEFVHLPFRTFGKRSKVMNTYMFNKTEVLKVIEKNKEIYTKRLGLAKDSKSEEIYQKLKQVLSDDKCDAFADIEGLTLGFPKHNTMIYQLEQIGNLSGLRKKPQEHKKQILAVLHSEKSPYKDLSRQEIESLENTINSITNIDGFHNIMYDFVKFAEESAEFERINKATQRYINGLREIEYTC